MFEDWNDSPVTQYILDVFQNRKTELQADLAEVGSMMVIDEEVNAARLLRIGAIKAYDDILNIEYDDLEELDDDRV